MKKRTIFNGELRCASETARTAEIYRVSASLGRRTHVSPGLFFWAVRDNCHQPAYGPVYFAVWRVRHLIPGHTQRPVTRLEQFPEIHITYTVDIFQAKPNLQVLINSVKLNKNVE
jgi:hypothetical protein